MNSRHTGLVFAALVWVSTMAVLAEPQEGERRRAGREGEEMRPGMRAEMGPDRGEGMQGRMKALIVRIASNPEIQKNLSITEEQVRALQDGSYELRRKQVDLRARLERSALEQARLMTQPDVDEKAVMKLIEKTGRARTELAKSHVRQLLLIQKTLTHEQINGLRRHMREQMQKRDQRSDQDREGDRTRERLNPRRDRAPGGRRPPDEE